jgi:hypothetical protein
MESNRTLFMYQTFKLAQNKIGQHGVRELLQCHWPNLSIINLSNKVII